MNIRRETIGWTAGHAAQRPSRVEAYTLDTERDLSLTVWTYGATLVEVLVPDRSGCRENVVMRLPDLASYENRAINQYLGATMGRYARCISGGRLRIAEKTYQLDRNIGGHHFHGGPIGFDRLVWEAEAEQSDHALSVRLRLHSPDGDQGYPGTLCAETVYRLEPNGSLSFEHSARTTAITLVSLTNHTYWNLAGTGVIDGHELAINASQVVAVDKDHIPSGPVARTADTALDFTTMRPIGSDQIDRCFVLDELTWAAELIDPVSKRVMRIRTDQPGLAVYTADSFISPRGGVCLQTGALPDSPNRPDFPSSELEPSETYRHVTVHEFAML